MLLGFDHLLAPVLIGHFGSPMLGASYSIAPKEDWGVTAVKGAMAGGRPAGENPRWCRNFRFICATWIAGVNPLAAAST
jgi:hypothetical protein